MTDSDGFQRIGDLWAYAQLSEGGQGKSLVRAQRRAVFQTPRVLIRGPQSEAEDRWMDGRTPRER